MTDESSEIRAAYDRFLAALSGGDHGALMDCFSRAPDTLLIGTAPEERFVGYDTVEQVVTRLLPAIRRAGLSFRTGQADVTHVDTVGWVADRLTVRATGGASQELRALAIFRLEDSQWKLAAYHHSLGIPDSHVDVFRDLG